MRRSKSDPAKYARNYRKISQRRMTQYDGLDEEKEIQRLRSILRSSEKHLERANDDSLEPAADTKKKKRKRYAKSEEKYGTARRKRPKSGTDPLYLQNQKSWTRNMVLK